MSTRSPVDALDKLRHEGAAERDPARFRYLESLAGRLAAKELQHSPHWQQLAQAVTEFEARHREANVESRTTEAHDTPSSSQDSGTPPSLSPLAELLAAFNQSSSSEPADTALSLEQQVFGAGAGMDMSALASPEPSAKGLRPLRSLARARAEVGNRHLHQRLHHAITQIPADAGPMNAHRLVSRALAEMQRLSPDYTLRFARYMDTLMALERLGRK